jgi:hypothetical protein
VKPSCTQYVFAKNWPLKAFLGLAAVLGVVFAVITCQPTVAVFHDWQYLLLFVVCLVGAPILFFLAAVPIATVVLTPLYQIRARRNGAPFRAGDRVRILAGPHRDRLVRVYAIWEDRHQVRVELDAQAKTEVKDVFRYTEICRESES